LRDVGISIDRGRLMLDGIVGKARNRRGGLTRLASGETAAAARDLGVATRKRK